MTSQRTLPFTDTELSRAATHANAILQILQRGGPVSSTELKQITHRFSARIHDLRERGYQISVEKQADGTSIHTLKGEVTT